MEKHKLTEKEISELQNILVQACIDFINERGISDLEDVNFSVDMLQESARYGEWCPCTDSSICGYGYKEKEGMPAGRELLHSYF